MIEEQKEMETLEEQPVKKGKFGLFKDKALAEIQQVTKSLNDKMQADGYERRMKKYNPLFPKDLKAKKFNCPNVIKIVDDAVRRDIDVCKGAVGWLENVNGVEILNLYDEYMHNVEIQFVPVAKCDEIYCVDPFDRTKYINVNEIFDKANEEKMAELKNIAYMLGAKSCEIEIKTSTFVTAKLAAKITAKIKGADASGERSSEKSQLIQNGRKTRSTFGGNDNPVAPKLKWFAHDSNINRFIEMRCNSGNRITSESLEVNWSSCTTMSQQTACAIDKIAKIGAKMESKCRQESNMTIVYNVEF